MSYVYINVSDKYELTDSVMLPTSGIDLGIKNSSGQTAMQLIKVFPADEQLRFRSLIIGKIVL